jgi:Domain of unknown function (DUF222)/HNH endonuclease
MDAAPATTEIEQLSDDELAETYIRACRRRDQEDLFIARLAAEFAKRDKYDLDGFVSPIDWMRFNGHVTSGAAANSVVVGESMHRMPESIEAMHGGELGFAHLTVMARTAEALGDRFDESALIKKARESSPGKFHYICTHYRHAADPKQYADEQAEQVQQRRLKLSRWMDGTVLLSGQLDPEGGAVLLTTIGTLARKSGAHDDRDLEQRQGDALVELASGGGSQAQIQVTSSIETLLGLAGAPAADVEFSLPVSSRTVERLACDSSIARVLLDSESMVIDVGRSKRVVSEPTRRALWTRDGHCRWPSCDRPATWSAAHHVVHWIHGGPTDMDNLVLLCRRHHWMVHEGDWQIVWGDERQMITIPPTVTFGPPARGPDR